MTGRGETSWRGTISLNVKLSLMLLPKRNRFWNYKTNNMGEEVEKRE